METEELKNDLHKVRVKKKKEGLEAPKKIKLLVTIVQRNKADFYTSVIESFDVNYQTIIYAKGTAPSDIVKVLGLQETDKAIILSYVPEDKVSLILNSLEDKYFNKRNGKGVAFSVPMSSLIGVLVYQFLGNMKEEEEFNE